MTLLTRPGIAIQDRSPQGKSQASMAKPTSAITRAALCARRLLISPPLSRVEAELEQRKHVIRGRLRICRERINRMGVVIEIGGAAEALSAGCLLVGDLRLALLALHGIPEPEEAAAVLFKGLEQIDLSVPSGKLRNELATIVDDLKRLLHSPRAQDDPLAVKAWLVSCREFLGCAGAKFKALRSDALYTSRDRYKRRLGFAAAAAAALVAVVVGAGTGIYYATAPRITVEMATYGMNCDGKIAVGGRNPFQVPPGNATAGVAKLCEGVAGSCAVTVSGWLFGDPAPNCAKDFMVVWRCNAGERRVATLPAEAMGNSLGLSCR